ncbi:outer membrane protein assembly factor [Acetonema longum]|uniref:Surface antigen (D15) n=1 Tax=Acetonema longum DSM 6540 TaxID=1009370 RepID=F7NM23_9FIRM|nr:BamA/TamA family outer membrane protein [Acetonema longum]EGO62949.1 surface antigen (D15) [Acetonema longum DSM 6540]
METIRRCGRVFVVTIVGLSMLFGVVPAEAAADFTGKTVTAVSVSGNAKVSADAVMAAVKIKPGDTWQLENIKKDIQSIYELGFFLDVVANFTDVPEGVKVVYNVVENPVYKEVHFKGNNAVKTEKLQGFIKQTPGSLINAKTLQENLRDIEKYYHTEGYILTRISDVATTPDGVLTISFNEGLLEDISVKGYEKTKLHVITRELKLDKGQAFNINKVKRAVQRVYNLGYFEDVNMKLLPGREPNGVVLEISVVEQRTGTFSIGAGYSKADGMVGIIGLGDNNFLGTGDKIKINWEFGGKSDSNRDYEFGYVRPWLDSKETSLGFNIYDVTYRYNDYEDGHLESTFDRNRKGWDVTLGRPAGEYIRNYITYKDRTDTYEDWVSGLNQKDPTIPDPSPADPDNPGTISNPDYNPDYLKDNFGTTRSITLSRVFDSRDNVFSPTTGLRYSLSAEFAGDGLGGDFDYDKYTVEGRKYYKVGRAHVVALRLTGGYADGNMPDSGKFSVGGSDTLRGFNDDQYKGDKMLAGSVEYRFPIVSKVQGVLFSDIGKAWDGEGYKLNDLETSIGIGLRINTPIGPIRLDVAKGHGQDSTRTHFSFGGQF